MTHLAGSVGSTYQTKTLTCKRGSLTVKTGDPALVRTGSSYAAALVSSIEEREDAAGNPVSVAHFGATLKLAGGTALSDCAIQRPTGTAFVNGESYHYGSFGRDPSRAWLMPPMIPTVFRCMASI